MDNPENPFAEHTMVFIPYCTGGAHMGNNPKRYESEDGTALSVNHVGFVNVSAALS